MLVLQIHLMVSPIFSTNFSQIEQWKKKTNFLLVKNSCFSQLTNWKQNHDQCCQIKNFKKDQTFALNDQICDQIHNSRKYQRLSKKQVIFIHFFLNVPIIRCLFDTHKENINSKNALNFAQSRDLLIDYSKTNHAKKKHTKLWIKTRMLNQLHK